ncbi:fatty acid desaturase [Pseudomonas sp.]|uniref:fatty acid desaturase n=1 Tax=Pseudomonas sp. TaxID=306 RepID=UPI0026313680|nr:fatty acid desaturase [Pseudomonas sp.]
MSSTFSSHHLNTAIVTRPFSWLVIYTVVTGALYFLVTHFPMGVVREIQPAGLDAHIARLPYTLPLYLSYVLIMPALVLLGRRREWLLPAFFAAAVASATCLLSHLFWPTMIERADSASQWLNWLYQIDSPLAASPSGHVALPVAISVVLGYLRVRAAWLFSLWSLALGISVLTTGQHVLLDVVYGAAIGGVAGLITVMLKRLKVDLRTMAAILLEWLCIVVTLRIALYVGDWRLYGVAFVVIAARQHALFILYHDATHYHLTRHRLLNDFLINLAIGVPGLVPVEFYRPLHLEHHQQTGTANDPERRFLYHRQPWDFRPLSGKLLLRQVLGDLFLINTLRNLGAYKAAGGGSPKMTWPALTAGVIWLVLLSFIAWQTSAQTLLLLAFFWFVPLVTLGTLLQKIRSIAEHSGGPDVTPGWREWTYAWKVGCAGRFFIWPYHINLHLHHHRSANHPWHVLPRLVTADDALLDSRTLPSLLWAGMKKNR